MNTSITDKLPIESIGETITGTIKGPVTDSVHRVGEFVPDHVPGAVVDAVNDGVTHGQRFGRRLVDRIPGRSSSSNTKRWVILGAVMGLAAIGLVVWRARSNRDQADIAARDNWSATGRSSGTSDRVA